jgi:3-methyladenine DNA glycosylase Mpg
MKMSHYLAFLMILASALISTAFSQEQVVLTVYVHEGNLNGTLLSGVQVAGQDDAGNSFRAMTDSSGAASISGLPGTWHFTFAKEGYQTLNLNYDAIQTEVAAAYLLRAVQPQEQVALTIYVHEGDLNGTLLSGVQVDGQDAAGDSFRAITDSEGAATVSGLPGTWHFTFAKTGYQMLNLNYDVTQTEVAAAYLLRAVQPQDTAEVPQPSLPPAPKPFQYPYS